MWERLKGWIWIIIFDRVMIAMMFATGYGLAAQIAMHFGWR